MTGQVLGGQQFSGAMCPGLIEANHALDLDSWAFLFSGAMCPGLIEARQPGEHHSTTPFVFRGHVPRPH